MVANQKEQMNVTTTNKSKDFYQETLDAMPHHLYQTIMFNKVITHKSKGDEHHQNHKGWGRVICWWMLEKFGKNIL